MFHDALLMQRLMEKRPHSHKCPPHRSLPRP
jgi:hypothetical protein